MRDDMEREAFQASLHKCRNCQLEENCPVPSQKWMGMEVKNIHCDCESYKAIQRKVGR